jgi:hypothetical protein
VRLEGEKKMLRRPLLALLAIGLAGCATRKPLVAGAALPPAQRVALLPVLTDNAVYEAEVFAGAHSDVVTTPVPGGGFAGGALAAFLRERSRERQSELDQVWATVGFQSTERVDDALRRRLIERNATIVELADPAHHLHHARQIGDFREWRDQADAVLDVRVLDAGYQHSGSRYSPMLGIYAALIRTATPQENGGTDYWFDVGPAKGDPNTIVCPPTLVFHSLDEARADAPQVREGMEQALAALMQRIMADLQAQIRMDASAQTTPVTTTK